RRLGFELELTDAQVIRNFIEPARQFARNGGKPAGPRIFGRTFSPLRAKAGQAGFSREGSPDAELEQFRRTERAYGGREAYDRAKQAGRTKLNYRQWVQVRTPAFKAWFGDFELANLERSMRRVRGSDQAKAVRGDIVGKPLTNVET